MKELFGWLVGIWVETVMFSNKAPKLLADAINKHIKGEA